MSTVAAQVIARQLPYDLRCRILQTRDLRGAFLEDDDIALFGEEEARAEWQRRWVSVAEGDPGYWTATLLPNLEPWLARKHGQLKYPLAQMLTGHGTSLKYLKRIAKIDSESCVMCQDGSVDDARHTFEVCPSMQHNREKFQRNSGIDPPITCRQVIEHMLKDPIAWKYGCDFAASVIRQNDVKIQEHLRLLKAAAESSDPWTPTQLASTSQPTPSTTSPHEGATIGFATQP